MVLKKTRSRRGMTLMEMMISVAIFSTIGLTVAYLTLTSAQASHDGLLFMRTESRVRNALDLIRTQAIVGEFFTAEVVDGGNKLLYTNPWDGTDSALEFEDGNLTFYETEGGPVVRQIKNLEDVSFSLEENQSILHFTVSARATDHRNDVRPITLSETVLLRNKPDPSTLF